MERSAHRLLLVTNAAGDIGRLGVAGPLGDPHQ